MAPRPYWKGYLKLSLVACAVSLYPATSSSERISFRQINRKTGNRIRQQMVDDGTREPVELKDKARGYEYEKGQYLLIEDDEIDDLQVESSHTIEIDKFVPIEQIDDRYFDSPYYIVPNDKVGQDAFAVIREAMNGKAMVGLGRVVLSKRERPIILSPSGKGLKATTLRYSYEVRDAKDYFDEIPDIKIPSEMLKLAEHILESKAANFQPDLFLDSYEEALAEMLRKKQAGVVMTKSAPRTERKQEGNVIELLRRSLELSKAVKRAPAQKRSAAKEEQLRRQPQLKLPIKGGKDQKEVAAEPPVRKQSTRKKSA